MDTINLTYNTRLLMGKDDFQKLYEVLESASDAYNWCAMYITIHSIPLNLKIVHNAVYSIMREKFKNLPAQCVIRIYKEVISALRSIRSNKEEGKADIPERKNPSMRLDKRLYSNLSINGISLTGFTKNKRKHFSFELYPLLEDMFEKYVTADPLLFVRDKQIWLSIPFKVPAKPVKEGNAIGIDLGMKRFVVTSDGMVFDDKEYKARRRRTRYLKRILKGKKTKSAKRKLGKLKRKERNQSKDFSYRMANAVLEYCGDAQYIVMEDLKKIKKNTSKTEDGFKRKRHNKMFSQVPIAKFKEILSYKAALAGKRVETVSPQWTSQTDSRTNKRDGERKGCRYICKDGVVLDADWNAAINIAKRSNHPTTNKVPNDGTLKFFSRQASVNMPKAVLSSSASL